MAETERKGSTAVINSPRYSTGIRAGNCLLSLVRTTSNTVASLVVTRQPGYPFFVLAVTTAGGRVRSFWCDDNLSSAQGGIIVSRSVHMVGHPRSCYIVNPLLSLEVVTPENESIQFINAVIHMQENLPQKRFLVRCSSPFVRLAQNITALCAWCKQYLPGR